MRLLTLLHLLLFFSVNSFSQTQLLKEYNFNSGGYYLLVTIPETGNRQEANFYTADTIVLNQIKASWVFSKASPGYACGYTHMIYICKDGHAIEQFGINTECNEIATSKGYFYFDKEKVESFKGKMQEPVKSVKYFSFIEAGRSYVSGILKDSNLIMTPTPEWVKHDGYFTFEYQCAGECPENRDSVLSCLEVKIILTYFTEETFKLVDRGGSLNTISVEVMCNKIFSDRFNHNIGKEYTSWQPNTNMGLTSYWKKRNK